MDEVVIIYYRKLLRVDFENSGRIDGASICIEIVNRRSMLCVNTGDFMQIYINIIDNVIEDIRYICSCEPAANVAIEILCTLTKGKPLREARALTVEDFYRVLGDAGEEFGKKADVLLMLFKEHLKRYESENRAG